MNKKYFWSLITLFLATVLSINFSSCGDDDSVVLDNYIIGSWHTYKGVISKYGENKTIDISKTGEYSLAYIEVDFQNGGQAVARGWNTNSNGLTKWIEEKCTYSIKNEIVNVTDSNGETVSLTFDSNKTLCYKTVITVNGIPVTITAYLKK